MPKVLHLFSRLGRAAVIALTTAVTGTLAVALVIAFQGPSAAATVVRAPAPPADRHRGADHQARRHPEAGHYRSLSRPRSAGLSQRKRRIRPGRRRPGAVSGRDRQWRQDLAHDGPVLHLDAAQAPLVVLEVGAASQRTFFAWGGPDGGQVVDVTSDAGQHWYQAILGDIVMAVVSGPSDGQLVAFAQVATNSSGSKATTWMYLSKDGGRVWHYSSSLGAM